MSVISLAYENELDKLPESKVLVDSRLIRTAEQVTKVATMNDELCNLCNKFNAEIMTKATKTGEKVEFLGGIQKASFKYWMIVGPTITALVALNIVTSGWKLLKWLRQNYNKNVIEDRQKRLHSRDWILSSLTSDT